MGLGIPALISWPSPNTLFPTLWPLGHSVPTMWSAGPGLLLWQVPPDPAGQISCGRPEPAMGPGERMSTKEGSPTKVTFCPGCTGTPAAWYEGPAGLNSCTGHMTGPTWLAQQKQQQTQLQAARDTQVFMSDLSCTRCPYVFILSKGSEKFCFQGLRVATT